MGTRFIHKDGRVIPLHSDHGDQPNPQAQHAAPMNPPKTPAPVAGKEEHNHPEARPESPAPVAPMAPTPAATASASVVVPKMSKGKAC